jgi:hypothetical protein
MCRRVLGFMGLALLMSAGLWAQPRFKVPFEFIVGNTEFPAGEYVVHPVNGNLQSAMVVEAAGGGTARHILAVTPGKMNMEQGLPQLAFENRHGTYILRRYAGGGIASEMNFWTSKQKIEGTSHFATHAKAASDKDVVIVAI